VSYEQSPGSKTLVLMGVEMEMYLCGTESPNFGIIALKTNSDGGMRLPYAAYDGPHYNLLGNRALGIKLSGEDARMTIPISLSEGGWKLITPILKNKKAAERSAANMAAAAEVLEDYVDEREIAIRWAM
jgi:hypothetical protein